MIKILEFKKNMQNDIKGFVIENMKNELEIEDSDIFSKITKDLNDIEENYIKTGGEFLIACNTEENTIVGTIAIKFENKIAMLKRFYVSEKYRKMKIGYLLYSTLEEKIKSKNINEVYLISGKELGCAHKFYERNGWNVEEKNPGVFVRKGALLYKKNMEVDNMKKDEYKILKDLVSFNTINDKENKEIINYIERYLKNLGFKTEYKSKVLVMSIGMNSKLGFLGHTDTVEYINEFKNPFEVVEKNGFLYGLGVCDMKGGIAAMLDAVKQIDFSKLKYGLKLYFTYDEEIGFAGIYELLEKKEVYPRVYDFWGAYK